MGEYLLPADETAWVSERARALGFDACGVAPAEKFPELTEYSEWLERDYAGEMKYLEDPRRADPRAAMPGVGSLIVCALNYNAERQYSTEVKWNEAGQERPRGWISRYAWGDDYHEVLWEKLNLLTAEMRTHFMEPFEARAYADTGPIHERAAAKHAGLGWLAKNTLLINESLGSWLFLGVILTNLPLNPTLSPDGSPPPDRCGTCTRCLEACPTQAIVEPYLLDASRCISYLTIELRGAIPDELREKMGHHVFGCDICQDVCPWNRKAPRTKAPEFQPRAFECSESNVDEVGVDELAFGEPGMRSLFLPDLINIARLSPEEFREKFRSSPIKRTKWRGLVRNACIALGNARVDRSSAAYAEMMDIMTRLSECDDAVISESARWALMRIQADGD